METLYQVLAIVGACFLAWFAYRTVKGNPTAFSRENMSKSFGAIGILAIILIVFVTLLVFLVRAS